MNVISQIKWGDTLYLGTDTIDYGGKQYESRIVSVNFKNPLSRWGEYKETVMTVVFNDFDGFFRNLLDNYETKYNQGQEAIFMQADGTPIAKLYYQNYSLGENTVTVTFSNRTRGFVTEPINKDKVISQARYPNAPAWGETLTWFIGRFTTESASKKGQNSLKAYRVNSTDYVIGIPGNGGVPTKQYVLADDFSTDVTSDCSVVAGAGSDPAYYIRRTSGTWQYDFLYVNVGFTFKTAKEIFEGVLDEFFPNIEYDTTALSILGVNEWHFDSVSSLRATVRDIHFAVIRQETGAGLLQRLCGQFNLHYFFTPAGKLKFKAIDYSSLTPAREWQAGVSGDFFLNFPSNEDETKITNYSDYQMGFQYANNQYFEAHTFKKAESIARLGYQQAGPFLENQFGNVAIDAYPKYYEKAHVPIKHQMIELKYPERNYSFTGELSRFVDLEPGDYIKFPHPQLENDESHLFLVEQKSTDFKSDTGTLALLDITGYEKFDKNRITHVISNADFDGETRILDESPGGHNFVTEQVDIAHDQSDYKYGNSHIPFNGTSSYFTLGNPERHFDYDIWSYANYSVGFWIKFPTLGNTEIICGQYVDGNNFWSIRKLTSNNFRFLLNVGGVTQISLTSTNAVIDTNKWHFFFFRKRGAAAGTGTHTYEFFWNHPNEPDPTLARLDGSVTSSYHLATPFAAGLNVGKTSGAVYGEFKLDELYLWTDDGGPSSTIAGLPVVAFQFPTGILGDAKGLNFAAADPPY